MRRSFEGKRHQAAKSEETRKRCDRRRRGFGFFCAVLLCTGLISGGAAVSGESGAQEAVNAEAPADDAVQPEVPAQPVEEAQQNTPAPEDTEGGGEAGQQQEETPDQQEELYPEDDGNGEESVPSVSRPDAGSAESSAAPVGTTAEPLTVSVTTAMKYAFAGENVLTFETQITGGTEPFETSCEIDRDGTPVWSSQEYQPEVTYMPEEAGGYELVLSVTDAAGQAASGRCAIPVAVRHEESPSDWEPALKEVRMTGRYAEDLLAIARTQLGYTESADNFIVTEEGARQGYTRYGQWQGDAYEPWDAAFAAFCLYYAGVRDVPADTKAEKWADELKRRGMYRDLTAENRPEEGDFLFTRDGEVTRIGLVEKTDDTGVTAIEGDVGGAVARVTYGWDDARLAGFGDPRTTLTDEAAGVTVTGIFPEGATLTVQLLAEDADGFTEAQDRIHAALSPLYDRYAVNLADVTETAVYVPSLTVNGEAVSPCKKVRVGVSACGGRFAGHGDVRVLTFSDEQTELLSAEEKDGGDGADAIVSASFRTDRLSEFALTAVAPDRLTMRRTAADGDAKVTVTYGAGAGVPESAELRVRQIRGDGDDADRAEYQKRQAEAAALLETEAGGENAASQPDTAASGSPGNAENADVSRQTDQNAENAAADQQADQNAENVAADQTEDSKEYAAYMEEVEAALASGRKVQMAKLFDITILDKEGNEVEPLTPVRANIEFVPKEVQEGTDLELYQFQTEGEKPQVMENVEVLTDDDNIVNGIEFETDGFSVYGIVRTKPIGTTVLTADGETYTVTVSYTEEANLPADVSLKVEEITNKEEYEGYKSQVEEEILDSESKKVTAAHFFDITLMDSEGNELHPEKAVTVVIETKDTWKENEEVQVCHFDQEKDKPVIVESQEITNKTYKEDNLGVQFEAESFSVYGIVGTETITTQYIDAQGDTYNITVTYSEEAKIPEGAKLSVSEIAEDSEQYQELYAKASEAVLEGQEKAVLFAWFFDISIMDGDQEIQPAVPVEVKIEFADSVESRKGATYNAVHFTEDEVQKFNAAAEVTDASENANVDAIRFEADGFSVWGVTYTVDFEYSVNGKMYQFSLPGGGFVSFADLVEVLGIIGDTNADENGDENGSVIAENTEENVTSEGSEENSINPDTNTSLTLGDVEISDATRKFLADVASVEFSSPELVDVSKVEEDTTVGQIKDSRGLECEYSAELTEEQIAEINAQTVEAGDWALISVQPFTSEEQLTVTMKDGEVFKIRVTDAQIKKTVIDAKGDTWEITVTYGEDAQIPDRAELKVREILPEDEEYEQYYQQSLEKVGVVNTKAVAEASEEPDLVEETVEATEEVNDPIKTSDLEKEEQTATQTSDYARIFDIEIWADDHKVEPAEDVTVSIKLLDAPGETEATPQVVHFAEDGTELMVLKEKAENSEDEGIQFVTDEFSVYSVVYTVDFHYGVDGKTYEYSLAGGDSISLRDLILSLHILDEDSKDNTAEWDQGYSDETVAENTDESIKETDAENTAEDPAENVEENSDDFQKAQEFIDNIDQVSFSDESLVKVVKIEEDITAGELKKSLNLEPEYSADLTAEQIEQLNARQFSAVDWALISMKAFNTEETLTITMLSGEVFEIKVTDLQFKKYVISASGDTFEVTVSYGDDANIPADAELKVKEILPKDTRYSELIEKSEEELDKVTVGKRNMVLFEIAVMVNGVEVEPAEGSTVNVEIVSKDADLLPDVVAKDETAVQATGENNNPQDEVLMSDDSNSLVLVNGVPVSGPEEITAVQVVHHKNNGESEAVQNITTSSDEDSVKASFRTESLSNWLLSTDRADTTPGEVTIKVGDTITLRPIGSWDRKDALGDQGFDGSAVDNWERPVDSSVMRFEAFTKTDSQDTRNNVERKYQYYTGTALNPGSITLKTKDDKQLIVHVEQGGPSAKPGTVDTVDNNKEGITFNLFDYDIPGGLDYYRNMGYNSSTTAGSVSDCYIRNETVNRLTGLKFLGWGYAGSASGVSRENWYQAQTPTQGIVQDDLSGGYPVMNGGGNLSPLSPLFDTNRHDNAVTAYPNANGLFQKDSNGYYYYNSNTNYAEYNKGSNSFTVYESTYTQASGNAYDKDKKATKDNSNKNGKPIGFFPFHEYDSNNDLQVNLNKELNHHFGIDMSVDFVIPSSGYDANGNPIIFEFSGDDDLWVFIDGKLVLDIGGIHQPLTGKINFSEKTVEVEGKGGTQSFEIVEDDTVTHKMQVFYIERGGCDSNLNIRFNLPILKPIEVEKKLEGETSSAYTDQEFSFKLFVQKSTKTEDANTYIPYEGSYKVYDAQGRQVGDEKHTSDGTFKLKDGQHIETDQRLDTLKYYVEESGVDYKYFGTTKIDNLDTPGQIAPKTYDDTSYSVTSAKTVIRDDSDVVFTNIPVTGNIKLIKKDAERKNTLKGAVFELTKKDDTSFGKKVYTTNAAGKLMNGNDCIDDLNLMPGEYILTETQAPDGYLQIEPITFKIEGAKDPDDNTKFKVNVTTTNETIQSTFNMETGEFIVPNTSGVVLPATGGPGTLLYTLSGLALICGAALMFIFRMRRRERRLN